MFVVNDYSLIEGENSRRETFDEERFKNFGEAFKRFNRYVEINRSVFDEVHWEVRLRYLDEEEGLYVKLLEEVGN